MEPWRAALDAGDNETAWTLFLARYHRLIGATIARCTRDPEDAHDAFAHVCDQLWDDELGRLRRFHEASPHAAKFSTWLVVVVRNLAIDWRRARDGRPRSTAPRGLSALGQQIYRLVLVERRTHAEAYEEIRSSGDHVGTFPQFLHQVADTYRAVDARRWSHLGMQHIFEFENSHSESVPDDKVDIDVQRSRLAEALSELTATERRALQLFVVEQQPAADVARALGWANAKTVYNRVRRTLAALRARLVVLPGPLPPK